VRRVVDRLPGRHVIINETIDGTFPAHHPTRQSRRTWSS
jgi:hypothetical protein